MDRYTGKEIKWVADTEKNNGCDHAIYQKCLNGDAEHHGGPGGPHEKDIPCYGFFPVHYWYLYRRNEEVCDSRRSEYQHDSSYYSSCLTPR